MESTLLLDSPFKNRFGTNYAPLPDEILRIREMLIEPERQLQHLNEQILKLQSFIDQHRTLLSPIRRVPPDVLCAIFLQCLPQDHLPSPNLREAPLLLTGICKLWRDIVISTPQLWNRIQIYLPFPSRPPVTDFFRSWMMRKAEGVSIWLGRSGLMPLIVSLCVTSSFIPGWGWESFREVNKIHIDFTCILFMHVSRWISLTLDVPDHVRDAFRRLQPGDLKLLKELRLGSPRRIDPVNTHHEGHPLDALFMAPSLRVVDLVEGYLTLPIQWESLTEMVLGSSQFPQQLDLLQAVQILSRACSSLRLCTICVSFQNNDNNSGPIPSIVFPHLHTLTLGLFAPSDAPIMTQQSTDFLNAIVTPALKHFDICSGLDGRYCHIFRLPLASLVERSGCVLSLFTAHIPLTTVHGALEFLRASPSLTHLEMKMPIEHQKLSASDFLQAFAPPEMICSHLEDLTFLDCPLGLEDTLIAIAEARARKLKKYDVSVQRFIEDPTFPKKLQALREGARGLSIRWVSPRALHCDPPYHEEREIHHEWN